jgi:gas vesicle structural protein
MTSPFDQVILQTDVDQLETNELSLLETLDHVLNRGLVIAGEITISVADIDLIFLGLNVLVSSVEKAHEVLRERELPRNRTKPIGTERQQDPQ